MPQNINMNELWNELWNECETIAAWYGIVGILNIICNNDKHLGYYIVILLEIHIA